VAWSTDSRQIASGSWDRNVRLWDAAAGTQAAIFRGHEDAVMSVAFSPDGGWLVSASRDRTVRVWEDRECAELALEANPTPPAAERGSQDPMRCRESGGPCLGGTCFTATAPSLTFSRRPTRRVPATAGRVE